MESLQSRRILLCDRFGLSTDRELGRVKKMIPRERLMRSFGSRFLKKTPVLQAEIFSTARDGGMGNETFYGDGLRLIKGTN